MAHTVTHATTAVGTDAGNGEIGKAEWNANHTISLDATLIATALAGDFQPLDSDLTTIAGLTATSDNFIQSASSAWASRTPTQVTATLIDMVGDSGAGGTKGLVPAPAAGDAAASKFLKADGTWTAVSAAAGGSDTQVQFNDGGTAFGGDAGLVFNKTTNALTGTGLWTVTQGSANTGVFASTGYSLTGTDATGMINLAGTWNTSGNPTAVLLNITNTASGASSMLMDLQVGGTSQFSVTKSGVAKVAAGTVASPALYFGTESTSGFARNDSLGGPCVINGGAGQMTWPGSGVCRIRSTGTYAWANNDGITNGTDTLLNRVAAGIVGIRGTTTSAGGVLSFIEQTAPSAPAANGCYIYAVDNGAGKTQLMAIFGSGAAQQLAIEP